MGFNRFGGGRGGDRGDRGHGGYRGGGDRGGYGGGQPMREAPVHEGEEYDVEISDVSKRGDGIARVQGFIIFISGAQKGEKMRVRIKSVRNRFALGEVVGASQGGEAAPAASEEVSEDAGDETDEQGE